MASGRAASASSLVISGSGFASARITGRSAIVRTIGAVSRPAFDTPRNTSASTTAWARAPDSRRGREFAFLGSKIVARGSDYPTAVAQDNVFGGDTRAPKHSRRSYGRGARSVDYDAHGAHLFSDADGGIYERGGDDDGSAVLVIVHHGNVEGLDQAAFYLETLGSLYVFEVYAAESGRDVLHAFDEGIGILRVDSLYRKRRSPP